MASYLTSVQSVKRENEEKILSHIISNNYCFFNEEIIAFNWQKSSSNSTVNLDESSWAVCLFRNIVILESFATDCLEANLPQYCA